MTRPASRGSVGTSYARPEVLDPSWEVLTEVEARRDEFRSQGLYVQAARVQRELEAAKKRHEELQLEALSEKQAQEVYAMEEALSRELHAMTSRHDAELIHLRHSLGVAESSMVARHLEALNDFNQRCALEPARLHSSRQLLDLRCQEEHLRRQCIFDTADKIRSKADALESKEVAAAALQQISRQEADQAKITARHHKESEALRRKSQASMSEAVLAQERELICITKKTQVSKRALLRSHAQERLILEHAFVGWFNPKKLPSTPSSRPTTAPGQLSAYKASGSSSPQRSSEVATPSTDNMESRLPQSGAWDTPPSTASVKDSSSRGATPLALQPKQTGVMSLQRPGTSPPRRRPNQVVDGRMEQVRSALSQQALHQHSSAAAKYMPR